MNDAILELTRRGGGPVHVNYITSFPPRRQYSDKLLDVKKLARYTVYDLEGVRLPTGKIAIFVGSHKPFSERETAAIDAFCGSHDAVVFCDHTSNYKGSYRVLYPLLATQDIDDSNLKPDLLIHIGEISGDYYTTGKLKAAKQVWRVSEDGEVRDYFLKLSAVFEMSEELFFDYFSSHENNEKTSYLASCLTNIEGVSFENVEVPFSNIWVASKLSKVLPSHSVLHLAILNSLRAWNFFDIDKTIEVYSNVGGFGIDGGLSTLIGASFVNPDKIYFGVLGDLAFFYDMNSLGNRDVRNNVRILLINNGKGTEFRNYTHTASSLGDDADEFVAAARHYGNKSETLVMHYAEDLGYEYIRAHNKDEFLSAYERFVTPELTAKPMIFEVFTDSTNESDALRVVKTMVHDTSSYKNKIVSNIKHEMRSFLGDSKLKVIKKFLKK